MADMALGRFIVGSVERSIKDVFFSYYSHLVSFAALSITHKLKIYGFP